MTGLTRAATGTYGSQNVRRKHQDVPSWLGILRTLAQRHTCRKKSFVPCPRNLLLRTASIEPLLDFCPAIREVAG